MINHTVAFSEGIFGLLDSISRDDIRLQNVFQWLNSMATTGHTAAQVNLGNMYALGLYITQDIGEANYHWEMAAEKNDPMAMFNIAASVHNFRVSNGMPAINRPLFDDAAEMGNLNAILMKKGYSTCSLYRQTSRHSFLTEHWYFDQGFLNSIAWARESGILEIYRDQRVDLHKRRAKKYTFHSQDTKHLSQRILATKLTRDIRQISPAS